MAEILAQGPIQKMKAELAGPVSYRLPVGDQLVSLNALVGKPLSLHFRGRISCIACGRETKKSFAQGYCYPCFRKLAECDMCIMRPETCHFHLGTCRDEQWAQSHCMQQHYVYIANSSGLKVGITRGNQLPTRWIDQGATQAVPVFRVRNRFHSGLLESTIKAEVSDRTDWRRMLRGPAPMLDMRQESGRILDACVDALGRLGAEHAELEWETLDDDPLCIEYPVDRYPEKISSLNFDKTPQVGGVLEGIKGQYLLFDSGVINMRKFSGYDISVESG